MPEASTSPLVSVIVTTYNRAHLLPRAIDSILQQTYSNIELIIVDDGSTDNTEEVLESYASACSFPLKVLKHPENRGQYAAKNSALNATSGRFSTMLDSDDEFVPHAVETMVNLFEKLGPEYGMVFANCVNQNGKLTGFGLADSQEVTYRDTICGRWWGEFVGMWRTSVLEGLRLDERLHVGGHMNFIWHQVYRRCRVYYLHTALRKYYTDTLASASTLNFDRSRSRDAVTVYRLYLEEFGADIKRFCPKCLANYYRMLTLYQVLAEERADAVASALRAIKHWPKLSHVALLALPLTPLAILKPMLHRRAVTRGRKIETPRAEGAARR